MTKSPSKLRVAAWLLAMLLLGMFAGGLMIAGTADVCTQYAMLEVQTVLLLPVVVLLGAIIPPILAISLRGGTLLLGLPYILALVVMLWSGILFWRRARAGEAGHIPAAIFATATTIWSAISTYGFCISLSV